MKMTPILVGLLIFFGVGAAVLSGLVILSQDYESKKSNKKNIDVQNKNAAEVLKKTEDSAADIKEYSTQLQREILSELRSRAEGLRESLWKVFPEGYVLYGGEKGNIVCLPFFVGDMEVTGDWKSVGLQINRAAKTVQIELPKTLHYVKQSEDMQNCSFTFSGIFVREYKLNEPVDLRLYKIFNQPRLFFLMVDDDPNAPIWALGYKKDV